MEDQALGRYNYFFKKYFFELVVVLVIIGMVFFSLSTLTTKPRLWTDEAMSIELARNFSDFGRLDLMTEPGVFSGIPYLLQSTGYPMTIGLAGFFKIFGFGLIQARVFALILMIILLILVFWFIKNLFGKKQAVLAIFLIASFAPFYGNGRCVTGEILGFIFMIFGLYFLLRMPVKQEKQKFFKKELLFSGFFLGLAIVSKPSVYMLVLPAALITIFFQKSQLFGKVLNFLVGMVPAAFFWIIINIPDVFLTEPWLKILNFYRNPYTLSSDFSSFSLNFKDVIKNTTLIYIFAIFLIIIWAVLKNKDFLKIHKNILIFVISYDIFAFVYFFRSPGWMRYLIAAELLGFLVLFPALEALFNRLKIVRFDFKRSVNLLSATILFLALGQTIHLFTKADLFYSAAPAQAADFVNQRLNERTVGIYNAIAPASLILPQKRYQIIDGMTGLPTFGKDFLLLSKDWPDLIVSGTDEPLISQHENIIKENYKLIYNNNKYNIFDKTLK